FLVLLLNDAGVSRLQLSALVLNFALMLGFFAWEVLASASATNNTDRVRPLVGRDRAGSGLAVWAERRSEKSVRAHALRTGGDCLRGVRKEPADATGVRHTGV